jgi:hypothetical protein
MFPECSPNVPRMFPECSECSLNAPNVPQMGTARDGDLGDINAEGGCFLNIHNVLQRFRMFPECSECSLNVPNVPNVP